MPGDVRRYAESIAQALGPGTPNVTELLAAAEDLDAGAVTVARWEQKVAAWGCARDSLTDRLGAFLFDGLPKRPGVEEFGKTVRWGDAAGLRAAAIDAGVGSVG